MQVIHIEPTDCKATAVCVKWMNDSGTKEVSIACNDSAGALQTMARCDLRCYARTWDGSSVRERNVTETVFKDRRDVWASNENVRKALDWLGD